MQTFTPLSLRECLWGDRDFYHTVAVVALPIMLQNTLSSVVSLLDNVMVGQVGTLPMSAVSVANQLLFVYYLCIFAAQSGAGILGAQYYGAGDMEGVRRVFRLKLIVSLVLTAGALGVFLVFGRSLVQMYLAADTAPADAAATLAFAWQYLLVMLPGLPAFAVASSYASTLRESGETALPMRASVSAMLANFVLNAIMIFGLLGFPAMGVVGAGIATSISRYVELGIVTVGAHRRAAVLPYIQGLYRDFHIPGALVRLVAVQTTPLLVNEFLWSAGVAVLLQCYSVRGIQVIAAMNIANTVSQVFNQVFLALGQAAGIMTGQELGADRPDDARRTAWRMIVLSGVSCVVMGALLAAVAPAVPRIYNTEPEIRLLAAQVIRVLGLCMVLFSIANAEYFILRSGGKTFVTFLFDSCFSWAVSIPAAWTLCRMTALPLATVYLIVSSLDVIKCCLGFVLVKKGIWVKKMVSQ